MNAKNELEIEQIDGEAAGTGSCDVTLRVNHLKPMKKFYQDVLGFKLLGEFPSASLLWTGAVPGVQIQMLGLLQRSIGAGSERGLSGHITFAMPVPDHKLERRRLESLGLRVDALNHEGAGKRSLRFRDPEGNEVELLCCEPKLEDKTQPPMPER